MPRTSDHAESRRKHGLYCAAARLEAPVERGDNGKGDKMLNAWGKMSRVGEVWQVKDPRGLDLDGMEASGDVADW